MQGASRDALAAARKRLDQVVDDESTGTREALDQLGDQLFAVAELLDREVGLRRILADASVAESSRRRLAESVLGGTVGAQTLRTLGDLVASRWSSSTDLVAAVEQLATQATLAVADSDGTLGDVEDELFRFGRILDREPRLRTLLVDDTTAPDKRVELLHALLDAKVRPGTARLLEQAVRHPHARSLDRVAEDLAEAAAARRDRSIARVTAPVVLSEAQESRLADALSRLYGRAVSVQTDVDPALLGGLVVRLGDEVIDGSVAGRLRAAGESVPH